MGNICVIGMFKKPNRFVQFHGEGITSGQVEEFLKEATTIVTFNGDLFDLPMIKKYLNLDLRATHSSHDLFKVKKQLGIKGGLKALEKMFGIERKTVGMTGYDAVWLWEKYVKRGRDDALSLLLEYNKEDVLNLIPLEEKFNALKESL